MRHIKISDGSTWPRPAMESDPEYGLGWKLRHCVPLTHAEELFAASVIDAYGFLLVEANRGKRDLVAREVRRVLESEASSSRGGE